MAIKKLGDVVRELRERQGMTQQQLAERAQLAVSYVVVLEAGQGGKPPTGVLTRLARALGVTVKRLEEGG